MPTRTPFAMPNVAVVSYLDSIERFHFFRIFLYI